MLPMPAAASSRHRTEHKGQHSRLTKARQTYQWSLIVPIALLLLSAVVSFLFARPPGKAYIAARALEGSRQSAEKTESTFSPRSAI